MIKRKHILPVLVLSLFSLSLSAQFDVRKVDKNLEKIYQKSSFPGFAVSVVKNDSILFANSYGYSDVKNKVAFSKNTILPIASVSKTIIAFSLAKAIELGYFTENTPINDILPFKISNSHYPNDTIRVVHLFTHTSGIIDNEKTFIGSYQLSKTPSVELGVFLKAHLSEEGTDFSTDNFSNTRPGSAHRYSNIASALAAYLVEVKAKMPFHQFTQKYLFDPLQLNDTHWFYNEKKSDQYAKLYEVSVPDLPYYKALMNDDKSVKDYCSITYPDGSLRTSLSDLATYISEIIKGYNGRSNLMGKAYYEMIFRKRLDDNIPTNTDKKNTRQAMFWTYNNKGRLTHNGSDPGVFAIVSIDFNNNIGRILLINANVETDNNVKLINSIKEIADVLEAFD